MISFETSVLIKEQVRKNKFSLNRSFHHDSLLKMFKGFFKSRSMSYVNSFQELIKNKAAMENTDKITQSKLTMIDL